MQPTNEKSMFHFLCEVMEKAASGAMDATTVDAVCKVSKEACKLLEGERKRVDTLIKIDEHERNFGKRIQLRELASFGFTDTTVTPAGNPRLEPEQ